MASVWSVTSYDITCSCTEGYSGSDLTALAKDAALGPIRGKLWLSAQQCLATPTQQSSVLLHYACNCTVKALLKNWNIAIPSLTFIMSLPYIVIDAVCAAGFTVSVFSEQSLVTVLFGFCCSSAVGGGEQL